MLRLFSIIVLTLTVVFALLPHIVWLVMWIAGKVFRFNANYAPYGWTAVGLVALIWTLMAYGFFVGRWKVQAAEWTYENTDVPASFDGMRIVHISDLHLSTFEDNPQKLDEFVELINAANPDLICFTGDLVSLRLEELRQHVGTLRKLKAKYGVCSVLGNHDFFIYSRQYRSEREKIAAVDSLAAMQRTQLGWHLLRNESFAITHGTDTLTIVGVDNSNCNNQGFKTIHRGDLKKALQGTSGFRILLSHDPSHWTAEVIPDTDIPLTLSGHTHAAQIRLFGWTPASWVFNETCGRYDNGDHTLYVNIGLGCTAPVRFGANPEITIMTLKRKKNNGLLHSITKELLINGSPRSQGNTNVALEELANNMVFVEADTGSFFICKYEVTQRLWGEVMGDNPSEMQGDDLPVENVNWNDCQRFISKLNELTGKHYRLPTEAEWEYACRGGKYSKGYKYSGSNDLDAVAWYDENSDGKTHPVGQKQPNELGLYDMNGNVWEWCQDMQDGTGMCRGGSWIHNARNCDPSLPNETPQAFSINSLGLRLALDK